MRINIQLSGQNAQLYNKRLLHLHLPMGENPQLYRARAFLSIPEEEGPVHWFFNVCIDRRKDLSAVRPTDDPSNLQKGKKKQFELIQEKLLEVNCEHKIIVHRTVALPTRPPALSKTRLSLRVELGLTRVIRLSLRKRTIPLGESLLAMVTQAAR